MLVISKDENGDWSSDFVGSHPQEAKLYILADPLMASSPAAKGGWTIFASDEQVEVGRGLTLMEFPYIHDWSAERRFGLHEHDDVGVDAAADGGDGVSCDTTPD